MEPLARERILQLNSAELYLKWHRAQNVATDDGQDDDDDDADEL